MLRRRVDGIPDVFYSFHIAEYYFRHSESQ